MADYNRRLYLLYLLYIRRKKRRFSERKWWVHPILKTRYLDGAYYSLFEKLVSDPNKFFNFFRMSKQTFDYLLCSLHDKIKKEDTRLRMAIPPEEMLVVTLRYLASGQTLTDMHYIFKLGTSTLSNIVRDVCREIWNTFHNIYLKQLNKEDWEVVALDFKKRANFPMCIGAIDGKHIRINNFANSGSMYFNYKHFYSIVLLAVVDSHYKFLYVDIGAFGKDCDSAILQRTAFWSRLTKGQLNIPEAKPLTPGSLKVPYVFVADSAFSLNEHILKEFASHNLSDKQRVFNYRLHRARRYVECAFGILGNKWRIFHRALNISKEFSIDVVKACVVLHNIVRTRDCEAEDDVMISSGSQLQNLRVHTKSTGKSGKGVRSCFANYFVSKEGEVPWQLSKI